MDATSGAASLQLKGLSSAGLGRAYLSLREEGRLFLDCPAVCKASEPAEYQLGEKSWKNVREGFGSGAWPI